MPVSKIIPSLSHAVTGSAGTAVSTVATYPLDLVNTRLKVQRQLRAGPETHYYSGVADAFRTIWAREGTLAFFAGLRADVAKSVADSFLFFLFYNLLRARRLRARRRRYLGAAEELAIGAVAGACSRAFTTPIANVVTRRQTASLVGGGGERGGAKKSFAEVLGEIRRDKGGVLGLWAGYSASLVLTLNPSITFFLQEVLRKTVAADDDAIGSVETFLMAAVSKAVATVVTYPFQIAKARVQVSVPAEEAKDHPTEGFTERLEAAPAKTVVDGVRSLAKDSIFATVANIGKAEGILALYNGVGGEVLKAFFNHGITMASKDVIQKLLLRLYFAILAALQRHPEAQSKFFRTAKNVTKELRGGYLRVLSATSTHIQR